MCARFSTRNIHIDFSALTLFPNRRETDSSKTWCTYSPLENVRSRSTRLIEAARYGRTCNLDKVFTFPSITDISLTSLLSKFPSSKRNDYHILRPLDVRAWSLCHFDIWEGKPMGTVILDRVIYVPISLSKAHAMGGLILGTATKRWEYI